MKITSWNVNGLRAVAKRDFAQWAEKSECDIICLQETKIDEASLPEELKTLPSYKGYFNFADKKGYAGVAIYTKRKPLRVINEVLAHEQFNSEGRSLLLEFKDFSVLNLYMPHGGRDKSKLDYKLEVYWRLILDFLKGYEKPLVVAADLNIAHQEIDLARPQYNKKNIMFTPPERALLDEIFTTMTDSYRALHPDTVSYTWWPYMAQARERNLGWRIDYVLTSSDLRDRLVAAEHLTDILGSDHCPVMIKLS